MKAFLLLSLATTLTGTPPPPTLTELGGGAQPADPHFKESVVLIIDAQREYTDGRLPLAGVDAALHQTARLLARARAAGVPIIHIQQASQPGRHLFNPQEPFMAFAPEATPAAGETVVRKRLPNAFARTTLEQALQRTGRSSLIISGYMTHMCVSATARAAFDLGYRTTIIADACATRDLPDGLGGTLAASVVHRVALVELADRFSTVIATLDQIPN